LQYTVNYIKTVVTVFISPLPTNINSIIEEAMIFKNWVT